MYLKYIKNGYYIPPIHIILYFITKDIYLSTTITLKLYSTNYFYWFSDHFNFLPQPYTQLKQFIRFTDTGHIVSLLYYIDNKRYLPLAYNVHFVITSGYWFGKICLDMKDADSLEDAVIIRWFNDSITYSMHIIPYMLILYETYNCSYDECSLFFTNNDLYYSYLWLYSWFLFIYIPWRIITNDAVYSILEYNVPNRRKIIFISFIHLLFIVSNYSGKILVLNSKSG